MEVATVEAHLASATLSPRRRMTANDMWLAVTWLRAYEGDPSEDPNMVALATVAANLAREATRRERRTTAPRKA